MATNLSILIGALDIFPYIVDNGYVWSWVDEEGESAGVAISGKKIPDRLIRRRTLDITIGDLDTTDMSTILIALEPTTVSVTYLDPRDGIVVTKTFLTEGTSTYPLYEINGVTTWKGFTTKLTEQGGTA